MVLRNEKATEVEAIIAGLALLVILTIDIFLFRWPLIVLALVPIGLISMCVLRSPWSDGLGLAFLWSIGVFLSSLIISGFFSFLMFAAPFGFALLIIAGIWTRKRNVPHMDWLWILFLVVLDISLVINMSVFLSPLAFGQRQIAVMAIILLLIYWRKRPVHNWGKMTLALTLLLSISVMAIPSHINKDNNDVDGTVDQLAKRIFFMHPIAGNARLTQIFGAEIHNYFPREEQIDARLERDINGGYSIAWSVAGYGHAMSMSSGVVNPLAGPIFPVVNEGGEIIRHQAVKRAAPPN